MIKEASCVIAINPGNGYILAATRRVKNEGDPADDWGIIGGKTDGEDELFAAHREFLEETGYSLVPGMRYIGCFTDEEGWKIHVYLVINMSDLCNLAELFKENRVIEEGITVGYVPYAELIVKTFGKFNLDLLGPLFVALL